MMINTLVVFYSTYGHVHRMARAVEEGAAGVQSTEVRLRRIPELAEARNALSGVDAYQQAQEAQRHIPEATLDDLRWADGIAWGTPTRYGNMSAQMKQFLDSTGPLWQKGELEDKPAGVFTSTASMHGGQESTLLTMMVPLLHHGCLLTGIPYTEPLLSSTRTGGTPYGASHVAGGSDDPHPSDEEAHLARVLGRRVADVAARLA